MKKHEKIIKVLEEAVEEAEMVASMMKDTRTPAMVAYWNARTHEAVFALATARDAIND